MGWTQQIEYVDVEVVLPPPVKKKVWDGEKFVPMVLYKHQALNIQQIDWLRDTFGTPGNHGKSCYWESSRSGDYVIMDEQIYTWFQMKWSKQ
jgi:hypothetical protein